ncbi:hypothetical protein ACIXIR_20805 [Bacteroides fragilis]
MTRRQRRLLNPDSVNQQVSFESKRKKNWVASVPGGAGLKKEINIAVYRNASGARVDLLDKRRKGSKQFVLKFFESGTKERATNRGANRGIIEATHFFKSAVDSKKK